MRSRLKSACCATGWLLVVPTLVGCPGAWIMAQPPDASPSAPDASRPDLSRDNSWPDAADLLDGGRDSADDAGVVDSAGTDAVFADGGASRRVPIIFVHGHGGALEDWHDTIQWLIENDGRWSGFIEAGTASYQNWDVDTVAESSWLFNFTYYNRLPSDVAHTYTAGPGRIGSNGSYLCAEQQRPGYLPANRDAYYGTEVSHEYSRDLADFIDAVVRTTRSPVVDLVAHSMGGLVARSVAQFFAAGRNIRRLLLVSVPNKGYDLVEFGFLEPGSPNWMSYLEFAEVDATASWWDISFNVCGTNLPAAAWPVGLNATDDEAAQRIIYYSMLGDSDQWLSPDTANYSRSAWFVVVPDADHTTVRNAPETRAAIAQNLGTTTP